MHSNSKSLNIGSFQNTSKSLERGGLAHKTRKTTRERLTVYITDIFLMSTQQLILLGHLPVKKSPFTSICDTISHHDRRTLVAVNT